MSHAHILIIEDECKIAKLISHYLTFEGFDSTLIHNGNNALIAYHQVKPDLIILDINLPGMDGISICQSIRKLSEVPIIMLSAKVEEIDYLTGFEAGADDYVSKPFKPKELMARVKAVLKRFNKNSPDQDVKHMNADSLASKKIEEPSNSLDVIESGNIVLNTSQHQVTVNSIEVKLTANEFSLLRALLISPNKVFSRQELLSLTQGKYFESYERTIDSHIKNIRRKLFKADNSYQPINSIYGLGYKYIALPTQYSDNPHYKSKLTQPHNMN